MLNRTSFKPKPLPNSAFYPTYELGYVLGVVSGDGNLYKTKARNYNIRLEVKDHDFAERFKATLEKWLCKPVWSGNRKRITGFNSVPGDYSIVIGSSKFAYEFIKSTGANGTKSWRVPSIVKEGGLPIKGGYIGGLFNSEGSSEHDKVRIYSSNKQGLDDVSALLQECGIPNKVNPIRSQWYLVIYGLANMAHFYTLAKVCPK